MAGEPKRERAKRGVVEEEEGGEEGVALDEEAGESSSCNGASVRRIRMRARRAHLGREGRTKGKRRSRSDQTRTQRTVCPCGGSAWMW